jgi:hypothetical protein
LVNTHGQLKTYDHVPLNNSSNFPVLPKPHHLVGFWGNAYQRDKCSNAVFGGFACTARGAEEKNHCLSDVPFAADISALNIVCLKPTIAQKRGKRRFLVNLS